MTVGIVGGRGTGKSVFVALLAQSAINYTNEMKAHFRYYTDPKFTAVIGDIITSLKMKMWPPATLKGSLIEYRFWFGYSNILTRWLVDTWGPIDKLMEILNFERAKLFNIVEFSLYDISGEDVDILRQALARSEHGESIDEILPQNLRRLLECDVLVFLIDASKITTDINDPAYKEMLEYDNVMAQLMSTVALYRSRRYRGKQNRLFPVFVVTKFDTLEPKIRRALGIPDSYSHWVASVSRDDIEDRVDKILYRFFQHTRALVLGGTLHGVELEKARAFVSYVETELNEEGVPVPKVYSPDGISYEISYSRSEYIEFIKYFGKIANKIKVSHEEPGKYVVGLGR
ncbi:hypothetical protein Igag_0819 [Ignisphaera aggregans DSM 17230]|uniref:Uncharacterized protein n=1 Tax=Ignisphaera aggregans (strain DSM 17230 / JCM 13409 / AQ1.S1) TaxID=583356 RepID=E0STM6_IGNAA|nr:hypothetical protein Igag_0819 [Ignisphaera aggregans DSM 17230]